MSIDRPCVRSEKAYMWPVIIGVDVVVYAVRKSRRFSVKLMFVECRLISPKFKGFYVKAA